MRAEFPFTRYGALDGDVLVVSKDATTDESVRAR
jgi:hypothetical protein